MVEDKDCEWARFGDGVETVARDCPVGAATDGAAWAWVAVAKPKPRTLWTGRAAFSKPEAERGRPVLAGSAAATGQPGCAAAAAAGKPRTRVAEDERGPAWNPSSWAIGARVTGREPWELWE